MDPERPPWRGDGVTLPRDSDEIGPALMAGGEVKTEIAAWFRLVRHSDTIVFEGRRSGGSWAGGLAAEPDAARLAATVRKEPTTIGEPVPERRPAPKLVGRMPDPPPIGADEAPELPPWRGDGVVIDRNSDEIGAALMAGKEVKTEIPAWFRLVRLPDGNVSFEYLLAGGGGGTWLEGPVDAERLARIVRQEP